MPDNLPDGNGGGDPDPNGGNDFVILDPEG